MKKILLLICLLCITLVSAQAQYYRYGVKAGGGFSTAVGDDAPSSQINSLADLHGALIFSYEFASSLSVQPELHFSRKGFVYDDYTHNTAPGTALNGELRLDYIELPLMFKLQKAALFIEAGPYLGYLVHVSNDVNLVTTDPAIDPPEILAHSDLSRDDFHSLDAGYAAGIGLILQNGFFLDVRHTGSLRHFPKEDLKQRMLTVQLSIGYLVPPRRPGTW